MTSATPPRVIIHAADPAPLIQSVLAEHPDAIVEGCDTYRALRALIETFSPDVVFTIRFAGTPDFPAEALLGPHGPAWISVGGSGVDHLGKWDPNKVTITNSAGVAAGMMAEYVMGGFLHFSLDIAGLEQDRQNRFWRSDRAMVPLKGKTLLIVGLGNTGQAIAARATAFGMHVIGTRAHPVDMDNVDEVHAASALANLWGRADFIAVCVPLLDSTKDLVSDAAFRAMKNGVVLADVSRGGVVDGKALSAALKNGSIGGAVLDVFEEEPLLENHPLWQHENVLISPHCSSVFDGWEQSSISMFSENLKRWRSGKELLNQVVLV